MKCVVSAMPSQSVREASVPILRRLIKTEKNPSKCAYGALCRIEADFAEKPRDFRIRNRPGK